MKRRFVLSAVFARRAAALGYVLLTMTSGAALAQTTGAIDPSPAPAQAAAKDDMPPPGGCTPIGLTVSGEIVFPFSCKDFIERQKAMLPKATVMQEQPGVAEDKAAATEDKPAAVEDKPVAAEDKPAAVEEKPAAPEEKSAAGTETPAALEEKPTVTAEQPAAMEEKPAAKQTESAVPELSGPPTRPGEKIPLPKRAAQKPAQLAMDPLCKHFRSYNPAAGTYKGYDGRMRPCK
jgi:BA14K-like protein